MKPARKVVRRNPSRGVGMVFGVGPDGAYAEHESFLERSFILVASVCPHVRYIRSQSCRIEWADQTGQVHTYVPDFELELIDGCRMLVEVKPTRFVPKHKDLFDAVAKRLNVDGLSYFVATDRLLPAERVRQAELCRRFRKADLPASLCQAALELAKTGIDFDVAARTDVPEYVWLGLIGRKMLHTSAADMSGSTRLVLERDEHDSEVQCLDWFGGSRWGADL